ncbi:hypothetical protein A3K73_09330 [Candidatus Pacearchaeota archaeon RBG_13_36_9]|nr:MAG: hypothetical protein A3K73_09330 [Candidatus Pacearchaeota archaeon RBG_13_36_9]
MEDRIVKLLINRVAGFIIFLLVLVLLNIFITYIGFPLIREIVLFFNKNVLTLGIMLLLVVLGEIFMLLDFPFNLPGPLFNAAGAVVIIYFVLDIFELLMQLGEVTLPNIPFGLIFEIIAILVGVVILVTGYISIFKNMPRKIKRVAKKEEGKEEEEEDENRNREFEEAQEEAEKEEKAMKARKEEKQAKPLLKKKVKKVKVRR